MDFITDNTILTLDELSIKDIKNINIQNGCLKSLNCLNGGIFEEIKVSACLSDKEYTNITAQKFDISNNLYTTLTFYNCNIDDLNISLNYLLETLIFVDCTIHSLNASNCSLKNLNNLPISLKYLNLENNNLMTLDIDKNNIQMLNIKNNEMLCFDKNNVNCPNIYCDSEDENLSDFVNISSESDNEKKENYENDYYLNESPDYFKNTDEEEQNTTFLDSYFTLNNDKIDMEQQNETIYKRIIFTRFKTI